MAKRLEVFDLIKGVGIILVVLGHSNIGLPLHYMIYSFHMPLFFMVSGFFFYSQPVHKYLKKTVFRLLVPWLFFVILNALLSITLGVISLHGFSESVAKTAGLISFLNEDCYILYRSIWFLIALFIVSNLYNLLSHYFTVTSLHLVALLFYCVGFIVQQLINLPFFIDTSISVFLFYHGGSFLRSLNHNDEMNCKYIGVGSVMVFAALMGVAVLMRPEIDFKTNTFPIWTPLLSVPIIIVFYYLMRTFIQCSLSRHLKWFLLQCGAYSICILGFHRLFQELFYIIFDKITIENANLQTLIFMAISIPAILLLSKVIERYVPFLIGMKRKTQLPENE